MQHVFIVGSKSIGTYGGYETFVSKLLEYHQFCRDLKYHVACKANGDGCMDISKIRGIQFINRKEFGYMNAHCFLIPVPNIGPAAAIYYDIAALNECCAYIKKNHIEKPVVYILACRIGPFMAYFKRKIHRLGGKIYVNPDGHEWMRSKWSPMVRKYWKFSERLMIKQCDLAICDSKNIERYIQENYKKYFPKTAFIAYGAETQPCLSEKAQTRYEEWLKEQGIVQNNYYLVVGRFVPENNYESMIREYMQSESPRNLVLITNADKKFMEELKGKTGFMNDSRIKFAGTVYDKELLKKIRENAYGYIHGHEVGGTNPSLLEALGSTKLNLLLDVGFNREVAQESALYWSKKKGDLSGLINMADHLKESELEDYGKKARQRIKEAYSWQFIASEYERAFKQMEV